MLQKRTRRAADLEPVPIAILLPPVRSGSRRPRPSFDRPDRYGLTADMAAAVLASYTRVGQLVIDPHASPAVHAAANWLDRSLSTGPLRGNRNSSPVRLVIDDVAADDFADPQVLAGRIHAWRGVLALGGHAITAVPAGPIDPPQTDPVQVPVDPVTEVIVAARAAGLAYQQHLVAVHEPVPEPHAGRQVSPLGGGGHRVTHRHLLVFRNGDACPVKGGADA